MRCSIVDNNSHFRYLHDKSSVFHGGYVRVKRKALLVWLFNISRDTACFIPNATMRRK